ncbi:MAG: hypothetical protein JNM88_02955 [Chitinophagaceae bacterium]|nr:hypothetical protein [Chitinophagaceae bacterium]
MCHPISGFKLCTCANEPVIHNKNSRRNKKNTSNNPVYKWHLLRYERRQPSGEIGLVKMPASDIGNGLTATAVLEQLNTVNCFDFDYTPQEKDELHIQKDDQWEEYLAFSYQQGKWVAGALSDPFNDVMENIGEGKLKPVGTQTDPG